MLKSILEGPGGNLTIQFLEWLLERPGPMAKPWTLGVHPAHAYPFGKMRWRLD